MAEDSKKLQFDTLLINHIGQFGKFQLKLLGLLAILELLINFMSNAYIFTTARIPSRCYISECDGENPEYAQSWVLNAIPGNDEDSFEQCTRYANISTINNKTDYCSANLFDATTTVKCDNGNVYENTDTIVFDFDLGCDEWKRAVIGTYKSIGNFIAAPFMGVIGDHFGRKTLLIFNMFNAFWIGVAKYWTQSYILFVVFEVMESSLTSGCFQCLYVLAIESVGPKYRDTAGSFVITISALCGIIMSLIAWTLPNWRTLTLALYIPQIVIIAYYWLIPESTRWLLSKGRYDEATKFLKQVAATNGKIIPDSVLQQFKRDEETLKKEKDKDLADKSEPWLILLVFKKKYLLLRCTLTPIWWISMVLIYHGLNINSVNLSGNKYVNFMISNLVDVAGYWCGSILLKAFGRRSILAVGYFVCALCQIGNIFVNSEYYIFSSILYFSGKYVISVVVVALYAYTAELYPTKYRQRLFLYSSMMGRLGNFVAPLTPALSATIWPKLPFALYGGVALLSSCLMFLTPETKGVNLPDTIQEALTTRNEDELERKK